RPADRGARLRDASRRPAAGPGRGVAEHARAADSGLSRLPGYVFPVRVAMLSEFPKPGTLPGGGPQVAATRLVPELARRGVDVVVVAPAPWTSAEAEFELEGGGTLVAVPTGSRMQLARGLRPWRAGAKAAVARRHVDVVHGQNL